MKKDTNYSNDTRAANLRKQLETLQTRIVVHGNRLWQMPFTYVSFAAIASSIVLKDETVISERIFFASLSAVGILVLCGIIDAWNSYVRTANAMNEVEQDLELKRYTSNSRMHGIPHIAICLCTSIALGIYAALYAN